MRYATLASHLEHVILEFVRREPRLPFSVSDVLSTPMPSGTAGTRMPARTEITDGGLQGEEKMDPSTLRRRMGGWPSGEARQR